MHVTRPQVPRTRRRIRRVAAATTLVMMIGHSAPHAWIAMRDFTSGSSNRWTAYRIHLWGEKRATVIGREIPLSQALELAQLDLPRPGAS